jgi:hypothetical protein
VISPFLLFALGVAPPVPAQAIAVVGESVAPVPPRPDTMLVAATVALEPMAGMAGGARPSA